MNATVWIYVTRQIVTNEPYLVFGLLNGLIYLVSILLNPFIAYIGDKYRHPRLMLSLTNIITINGNILYIMYYSPWYPIIGIILIGFRFPMKSIIIGEIVRSYPKIELNQKLSLFANCYYIGLCPTVLILVLFNEVDIKIANFHISYGNISGVVIIFGTVILQLLTYFFVHDLSNEYDLKKEEQLINNDNDELFRSNEKKPGHLEKLNRLFTNCNLIVSYYLTFLYGYAEMTLLKYAPIVIITKLNYSVTVLNTGILINSLLSILTMALLVRIRFASSTSFCICIVSFLSMVLIGMIYKFMIPSNTYLVHWILALVVYALFSVVYFAIDVFLVSIVANHVRSDIQSFAESFRLISQHSSSLLASLSIGIVTEYYDIFCPSLALIICLSILLMLCKRQPLRYPQATA